MLKAKLAAAAPPDEHFCLMLRARLFVAGKSGMSELVATLRECRGADTLLLPNISGYWRGAHATNNAAGHRHKFGMDAKGPNHEHCATRHRGVGRQW